MLPLIKRAVFFGAHTDDEMVCAGTLHRLVKQGTEVWVVTAGPAATEHDRTGTQLSTSIVLPEWQRSLVTIGVIPDMYSPDNHRFYNITPSIDLAPHRQFLAQRLFNLLEQYTFDLALILSPNDQNSGHALMGSVCEEVTRGRVPNVLRCCFPWNYGSGNPNLYITLDESSLVIKKAVIECYPSQHFRYNYGSMLLAYAVADGLSVKVPAAEKFEVVRMVL